MKQTNPFRALSSRRSVALTLAVFLSACHAFAQQDSSRIRSVITNFLEQQASVRYVYETAISPSGNAVAWSADGDGGTEIRRALLATPGKTVRITAAANNSMASESEPQWSPDGNTIAFLSDARTPGQSQVYLTGVSGSDSARLLTHLDGHVSHLRWSPDGRYLSVLYVEKATRVPSPMAAESRAVGLIDSLVNRDIQRIAIIDRTSGDTRQVTMPQLYVFEYDWSPDSKKLAYTAAPPPGDDNWYVAGLYQQPIASADTQLVYRPTRQIAVPRWSPDGRRLAFIEGLMSDQGGTGGEIFAVQADGQSPPQPLTPNRPSTPSWFTWMPGGNIIFTEFTGGSVAMQMLNLANGATQTLFRADESMRAGNEEMSVSMAMVKNKPVFAFIRTSWNMYPEVWAGPAAKLVRITQLNDARRPIHQNATNITWHNGAQPVQGWLLAPADFDPQKKYPMLVCVHGGPAWITTPTWSASDFNSTVYTKLGYFVFFPNPRGSYGQGEAFTLANRRDWGFGDLQDILTGMDTVIARYPVDSNRIGIYGWSYGGSSAMFAVTQTRRFGAAVAGAGSGDWLSYYGQNSIDKWMMSYFNASPYDDPQAYARCSAMTYIKQVKTPTLVLVGERDGESPPPQSFQYWHALRELGVPTQLMVYPDEGHSFEKFENMIDVSVRTLNWFNTHLR